MSEELVLSNLIKSEKYARKVLPFLNIKHFADKSEKIIFTAVVQHYAEYNLLPTKTELSHYIATNQDISDEQHTAALLFLDTLDQDDDPDHDWLLNTTEEFVQEKSLYNAILDSIAIMDGTDEKRTTHAIPDLLKDALAVSFDSHIGHDYFENADERFEFYSLEEERIPFHLNIFNKITNGGVPNKTLNGILAPTNAGKTLMMVDFAAHYMMGGKNVLYITLEMAEEAISNRIDANLMSVAVNDVDKMNNDKFMSKIDYLHSKTQGKLIVKEFPTSGAHVGHFRTLLQELKLKKNFVPDVIMVDYINIMLSSRVSLNNTGSYFYIKAIAEELRGLAVEQNLPIWTATQSNRSGQNNSDIDLTNTSESFGLPATLDFMYAIIRTEELDQLGQLLIKQLKSRYGNKSYYEKFVIGVDPDKMQLFDIEDSAQTMMQTDGDMGIDHSTGEVKHRNALNF